MLWFGMPSWRARPQRESTALNTEPRAVATGSKTQIHINGFTWLLGVSPGHYRSRFCIE